MKTAYDPRHKIRQKIVQELFANEFLTQDASDTTKKILKSSRRLDDKIQKAAPEWPIEKINKVDLAILRLAVWELQTKKNLNFKVIIDEAIELAKEFGSDTSPSFINAVLGVIVNNAKTN